MRLVAALRRGRAEWLHLQSTQRREQTLTAIPLTIVLVFFFCGTPSLAVNVIDSVDPDLPGRNRDLVGLDVNLRGLDPTVLDPDLSCLDPDFPGSNRDLVGLDQNLRGLDPTVLDPNLSGLDPDLPGRYSSYVTLMVVANFLVVVNSASNIIIYCLVGSQFRNKLVETLAASCCRRRGALCCCGESTATVPLNLRRGVGSCTNTSISLAVISAGDTPVPTSAR